jgi:hypothetical protein
MSHLHLHHNIVKSDAARGLTVLKVLLTLLLLPQVYDTITDAMYASLARVEQASGIPQTRQLSKWQHLLAGMSCPHSCLLNRAKMPGNHSLLVADNGIPKRKPPAAGMTRTQEQQSAHREPERGLCLGQGAPLGLLPRW